jgi:sortase A
MTATRAQRGPARSRRGLRALANVLIVTGALLLADAVLTVAWQEPVSAVYTHVQQGRLDKRLAELERVPLAPVERQAIKRLTDPTRRLAFAARAFARHNAAGDPIGRIRLASAGINDVVVEGTGAGDLGKGPGHYPATPLPGQRGTVAIAGHRTTYGAPFRHLDAVKAGDRVEVSMPYGVFSYRVERTRIVPPTAIWVTKRVGYDRLILSACHPLYSAAQRIVVFARLEGARPRGAAAG